MAGNNLQPSIGQTDISYYNEDYVKELRFSLTGVQSKEDLISSLNILWEPLGIATVISASSEFPVRNFTNDFQMYWISFQGVKANGTHSNPTIRLSTDNGATYLTSAHYAFSYSLQSSSVGVTRSGAATSSGFTTPTGSQTSGVNDLINLDVFVSNPMAPGIPTQIEVFAVTGFGGSTNLTYGHMVGTRRQNEQHNALAFSLSGGRDWTAGFAYAWGLRTGVT